MMKKLLFTVALMATSFTMNAQKDISVTLNQPTGGTDFEHGVGQPLVFTVTNESATDSLIFTDSVYFGVYVQNVNIFGTSIYLAQRDSDTIVPGDSWQYTFPVDITFSSIPAALAGQRNFCVKVYLYEGSNSSYTTEPNMTNNEGCVTVNFIEGGSTAGIDGLTYEDLSIKAFPNPAEEYVNFEVTGVNDVKSVAIANLAGQTVISQELISGTTKVDVSSLKSGVYIYTIYGEDRVLGSQKLIIK